MRKKKVLIIIIVIILIAAAVTGVLMWRGVISFGKGTETVSDEKTAVAYVANQEEYLTIDISGEVLAILTEAPTDIPKITGIEFTNAGVGNVLDWDNTDDFNYAVKVIEALADTNITINEIILDDSGQLTLVSGDLKILLGDNEKTEEKIRDLNDFISELSGKKGTLNMKEVNDTLGYSFRPEQETVVQTTEAETAAEENADEENAGDENADDGSGEENWDEGSDEENWDENGEYVEGEENADDGSGEESWDDGSDEENWDDGSYDENSDY